MITMFPLRALRYALPSFGHRVLLVDPYDHEMAKEGMNWTAYKPKWLIELESLAD